MQSAAVLLRGAALVFFENLGEVALGRIVQKSGDFGKGVVGVVQKIPRLAQLFAVNVFGDAHTHLRLEFYGQAAAAKPAPAGKFLQAQVIVQMLGNIIDAAFHSGALCAAVFCVRHAAAEIHRHRKGQFLDSGDFQLNIGALAVNVT